MASTIYSKSGTDAAIAAGVAALVPAVAWKPATAYVAGDKVTLPSGEIATRRANGTSAASFTSTESAAWIVGTRPGQVPVIKPLGDGRAGVIEWTHNDTTGYLFHLLSGTSMGDNQALVALGVDNGGIGLLVPVKKTGRGIVIDHQAGITSATAYGIQATQESTLAPLVRLESNATDAAAALQLVAFGTPGAAQLLYVGDPTGEAGRIAAADGRILWQRDIRIRNSASGETARYFEVGSSSAANANNTSKAYHGATEDVFFAPTGSGAYYTYKFAHSSSSFAIQTAGNVNPAVATDPRPSEAGTYTTQLSISHTAGVSLAAGKVRASSVGVGFFGATAIAQPSRAGQLTDSSGGTSGGNTIAAVTDVATAANAIATLTARLNAIEAKLSAAAGGLGLTA